MPELTRRQLEALRAIGETGELSEATAERMKLCQRGLRSSLSLV